MNADPDRRVRIPWFPLYSNVSALMRVIDGLNENHVAGMIKSIMAQTGTPQNPVDWTDPDGWIPQRLNGQDRTLADAIWEGTRGDLNPRFIVGPYKFIKTFQLMETIPSGILVVTDYGSEFLNDNPEVVENLDELEGLPKILSILSEKSPARRGALLDDWSEYLREFSNFKTIATAKDTLRMRILNLVERRFIERNGNVYSITEMGLKHVGQREVHADPRKNAVKAIGEYNATQIANLKKRLGDMPPYKFEYLISELLDAMKYEDVEVTKQSGDKGVDVVAKFQFGITEIKEVVQIKRQQGTITRPVLDQLRGALPYHEAIRGTIITLGKFAKGCKEAALYQGAAPITLIDGDMLVELLIEHEIGIKNKPVNFLEFDQEYFKSIGADEEESLDE